MKRYWLLVILMPFCLLSIGTYYVVGRSDQMPDFVLKTIKGQETAVGNLLVVGRNADGAPIQISTKGSMSPNNGLSYLKSLDVPSYYDDDFIKLTQEHRSFMRGKKDTNAFYEDDKVLAYVGTSPFDPVKGQSNRVTISVINKSAAMNTTFHIQSDKKSNEYIRVNDVQVKDQIMKVIVSRQQVVNAQQQQSTDAGYDMYTIDLSSKTLLASEKLTASEAQGNGLRTSTTYMWESDQLSPNRYAIFDRSTNKIIDKVEPKADITTEKRDEGLVNRELLVYDIWKGQWQTLESEQLHHFLMEDHAMGISIRYDEQVISLIAIAEDTDSHVMRVNMDDPKVINDSRLSLQAVQKEWGRTNVTLLDKDHLHLLMYGRLGPSVATFDLQTGQMIYQGVVLKRDQQSNARNRNDFANVNRLMIQK